MHFYCRIWLQYGEMSQNNFPAFRVPIAGLCSRIATRKKWSPPPREPYLYTFLFIIWFKIGWIYSTIKYKIHVHIVWRPYSYHHIYTGWRFGLGLNQPNIWLWCETIFCGPHPLHAQTPRSLSKLKIKNNYLWYNIEKAISFEKEVIKVRCH